MRTKQSSSSTLAVLLASVALGASAQADGVKVGGAVEAGYSWTNTNTATGVSLKQSNFDFSGEFGRSRFMIDVPFTATSTTTTSMAFGVLLSQAFVAHKTESGFRWQVGQFDSMYGFEPNDLARGFFATHGIVYTNVVPFTQTGWVLGYGSGNWGVDFFFGNTRETSAPAPGIFNDYGLKFGMTGDTTNWSLGVLYNGQTNNTYMLVDGQLGMGFGKVRLDLNAVYKSQMIATVTTNTIAILAQPVFNLNESWDLGLRGEFTTATTANVTPAVTGINVSVGPNWNLSKNALMKMHYTLNSTGAGTSVLTHGLAIDGVIRI